MLATDPARADATMDALHRIYEVRDLRCGEGLWKAPPSDWRDVVAKAWSHIARRPLDKIPDGWIDVVMAMFEHLDEEHPGVYISQIHEDLGTGELAVNHGNFGAADPARLAAANMTIDGYEEVAFQSCRVCGSHAKQYATGRGRLAWTKVLCDRHVHDETDDIHPIE